MTLGLLKETNNLGMAKVSRPTERRRMKESVPNCQVGTGLQEDVHELDVVPLSGNVKRRDALLARALIHELRRTTEKLRNPIAPAQIPRRENITGRAVLDEPFGCGRLFTRHRDFEGGHTVRQRRVKERRVEG